MTAIKAYSLGLFACMLAVAPIFAAVAVKPHVVLGGREWTLTISGEDKSLLEEMKFNTYLPWCFESLQGRGTLKQLALTLNWSRDGKPSLSLVKNDANTHADDRGIIACLDASLKEAPPKHAQEKKHEILEFVYTKSRKS